MTANDDDLRASSATTAQPYRGDSMFGPGVNVSVKRSKISVVLKEAPLSKPPTTSTLSASSWMATQPCRLTGKFGPAVNAMVCVSSNNVVFKA
eukprot:CAMPEP_0184202064 /NCGR_PEP_ID=MMETSP0976-20121227/8361_1 /TAXON_ID=483370 /ORGANISM="non described non described, Strain CCMP2097" /LENGTH=92 /DNA_ID=CAMNT_0026506605 /DNA_START=42 /DNA_END=317 /DNA_ORIENTATION=-